MKKNHLYWMLTGLLLLTVACKKDDAEPELTSVGISFVAATDSIDMNTSTTSTTLEINVSADITKAELEERFKLKFTSEDAVEGADFRVASTTITENPLKVTVQIEALPSLARKNQTIQVSFDERMQPVTIGDIPTFTLTILPFSPVRAWYAETAYYAPYVYYYANDKWSSLAGHYSVLAEDDAYVLGFVNNYVQDSGIPFLNMVRIYANEIAKPDGGSVSAKTAKINVPEALEFVPASAGARSGTVKVIEQDVVVSRKDGSTFTIGISGSGTYNLDTKLIDLVVKFNETAIGGAAEVSYSYKISAEKLTF